MGVPLWAVLASAVVIVLLEWLRRWWRRTRVVIAKPPSTPSGGAAVTDETPKPIPGPDGNDHSAALAKAGSLTAYATELHRQYGPIVRFFRRRGDLVISCYDVELLATTTQLADRPPSLFEFLTDLLGPDNLQIYPAQLAKQTRGLIQPALNHTFIAAHYPAVIRAFAQALDGLAGSAAAAPDRTLTVRLQHEVLAWGLRSGMAVQFGFDVERAGAIPDMGAFTDDFHTMVDAAVESGIAPLPPAREEEYRSAKSRVEEALRSVVRVRRQLPPSKLAQLPRAGDDNAITDVLSALLSQPDPATGAPFSDEKLVMLLKMTTNYTGAVASTWVLHLLAAHDAVRARLVEEVDRTLGRGVPSFEQLQKPATPYLDAVVAETLRLFPTSPFAARLATSTHRLGASGFVLPAGATLFIPIREIQFDEVRWGSNAADFVPERWLVADGDKRAPHPLSSMPFGYGMRRCPGERLAREQIKAIVAMFLQRFDVSSAVVPPSPSMPAAASAPTAAPKPKPTASAATAEKFVLWAKDDVAVRLRLR